MYVESKSKESYNQLYTDNLHHCNLYSKNTLSKLSKIEVETPIAKTKGYVLNENDYAFVPILRAGMGMVDGVLRVMPNAKIGHIGLYRNEETLEPVEYFCKLPKKVEEKTVIILDPMLATGGSGSEAISMIKKRGVKKIKF